MTPVQRAMVLILLTLTTRPTWLTSIEARESARKESCHFNSAYDAIIARGSDDNNAPVTCSECHGTTPNHKAAHDNTVVPAAKCTNCHDSNVYVEHVEKRNKDCNICHNPTYQALIESNAVVSCLDCHDTPDHHANSTQAKSGDCTWCHVIPSDKMDAPVQGACRQCHINGSGYVYKPGSSSAIHTVNTNGAIKDFGACFACHSPKPYHAKPTRWPGWFQEDAAAPGRGTFNIFYNEFRPRCAGSCEQYEDKNGYGEDGKPSRDKGSSWRNPAISFNWAEVTYGSTAYDVPSFGGTRTDAGGGGIGGGGGVPPVDPPVDPPPTVENDVVTITYARWERRRSNRIRVYAVNDLGKDAQLAADYCGDVYSMAWDSNDNRWELSETNTSYCDTVTVTSIEGGSDTSSVEKR